MVIPGILQQGNKKLASISKDSFIWLMVLLFKVFDSFSKILIIKFLNVGIKIGICNLSKGSMNPNITKDHC